jgi:hypothetical protein
MWKKIKGYESYEISNKGEIRNSQGILKAQILGTGYKWVQLWRNGKGTRIPVHHLVATAFLGPRPKGMDVHHLDGNRTNNQSRNLKYQTRIEHTSRGSKHGMSKLTEKQVKEIRKLYRKRKSYHGLGGYTLAKLFNVRPGTIYNILEQRTWLHVK